MKTAPEAFESHGKFLPDYTFQEPDWWKDRHFQEPYHSGQKISGSEGDLLRIEAEFNERADRWSRETGIHSSPVIRFMHKDYQSIMAQGKPMVPLILKRLRTRPDDWFWALKYIVDYDAAASAGATTFEEAVRAWLDWGVRVGYLDGE